MIHKTVLLKEAISGLNIKAGDVFFDATLGGGGHSEAVCREFGKTVRVIATDLDEEAISRSTERLVKLQCDFKTFHKSFRQIDEVVKEAGLDGVDRELFDLGLSSNQFEDSGRGFSFQKDEPLLMTFKKDLSSDDITAREIVNVWDEENIEKILMGYGEESFAKKIANKIVETRKIKPIETTFDLVEIIKKATPFWYHKRKIHPATKTFQALRITVNDEMRSLQDGLEKGFKVLKLGGRMAVISFHSLEDRMVKNFFKDKVAEGEAELVNKKPLTPSKEELAENRRARSAKLRILQKIK